MWFPVCTCALLHYYITHTHTHTHTLGDSSSSLNTQEEEVDKRLQEAILMEDPDLLVDLRELNSNQSDNYKVFWKECESYLQECTAVHERRYDSATYLAKALSVRDLVEQVSKKCPPGTPINAQ